VVDFSQVSLRDDRSTERLVDLAMYLQSSSRGFTREEIGINVPHYSTTDNDNFGRMFERDKVELMSIGFDIEVTQADAWNQDEFRYRIVPNSNLLPEIDFTSDEVAVLVQATQAWNATSLKDDAKQIQLKLESLGVELSQTETLANFADFPALRKISQGIAQRRTLAFDYRKPHAPSAEARSLQAWGLALKSGSWYLYGFDTKREAIRCFNVARITSDITTTGKSESYEIPADIDLGAILSSPFTLSEAISVTLQVEPGYGHQWRHIAGAGTDDVQFSLSLTNPSLQIPALAADTPHVIVVEPVEIRQQVIAILRASL
jgi:proteasome accessory factor B/proteasome accessory factor C